MVVKNNARAVAWLQLVTTLFFRWFRLALGRPRFPHTIEHAGTFLFDGVAFGISCFSYEWLLV